MADTQTTARVFRLVEDQVIPRLLQARRGGQPSRCPDQGHIETLVRLALARDAQAAAAQVAALRESGMAASTVLSELITPAARRLGTLWCDDSIDFLDTTIAAGRLAGAVRQCSAPIEPAAPGAPAALIATPPRERHILGASVFSQLLRAAGWRVREAIGASRSELAALAAAEPYAMIGLSVSDVESLEFAAGVVKRARAASANQAAILAIGGPAACVSEDLAGRLGIDIATGDGAKAVELAKHHLSRTR
ncbi:MAG: B12-binding domain-containing protein [Rubrimonas sp.]